MQNLANQRFGITTKRKRLFPLVLAIALGLFLIPLSVLYEADASSAHSHYVPIVDTSGPRAPDHNGHVTVLAHCGSAFCAPSLIDLTGNAKEFERPGAPAVRFAYSDQIMDSLFLDRDPPIPRH